ncbi:MAG TPA: hypothetical protein VFK78_08380 [Gemmatimonadales bacterium]|nr:hypothetical protein [Gemmatimonadales bacterium]
MKFFISLAALALVAACDRQPAPTAAFPRAVVGVVELKVGDQVRRFEVRVERGPTGFNSAAPAAPGVSPAVTAPIAGFPLVRDRALAPQSTEIQTPDGVVTASIAYRPLGPYHVLDHAVASVKVPGAPGGAVGVHIAFLNPRLEP